MGDVALYVDPPSARFRGDRFFDLASGRFHSSLARCLAHLRDVLTQKGIAVHTADLIPARPGPVEIIYVSIGMLSNYRKLARRPDIVLSALLVTESPIVEPSFYRGLKRAQHSFRRIYSCPAGEELERFVGAPLRCSPFRWPLDFESVDQTLWEREDRDFLVMVNMNKLPRLYWNELFTERVRAVDYFARFGEIDLYGVGWNEPPMRLGTTWMPWTLRRAHRALLGGWDRIRPSPMLERARRVYRGELETKNETLARYKFAICFENTILKGWLTEKIFECFHTGTVPIYWGAADVDELIPPECFIDMRSFENYDELRRYLKALSDAEIRGFKQAARAFMQSPSYRPFSRDAFVDLFLRMIEEDTGAAL